MNTLTKKSRSTDQAKVKLLCDILCDDIEGLLEHLDVEYKYNGKMITGCCPIHGGDNPSAISLYPDGDTYRGNWKCRTHGCEKYFKPSLIGFIRGVLSNQKYNWEKEGDQFVGFDVALDFAQKYANQDLENIRFSRSDRNKQSFTSVMNYVNDKEEEQTTKIKREYVVKALDIPSQYYLDRGYSSEILEKYDVGLCRDPDKPMHDRVVVPIYDNDYKFVIGSSGRSVFGQCEKCGSFHHADKRCPSSEYLWMNSKWKHSKDFKSQNCLYNYWFAKEHILETMVAVIVESPGNVWRLEEAGIHNSVAIFGSSMSDRQKIILDGSGAMHLVVLTDNDEAGRKAADQIAEKCRNTYNIHVPKFSKADVGEMTIEEINQEIKPVLEKIV